MRVAFQTFGCKLNQFETESLADTFRQSDNTVVSRNESADVYIINTCTVTSRSEQKARSFIRSLAKKRRNALIVVTGCYAQVEPGALSGLDRNIILIPQERKDSLHDLAAIIRESWSADLYPEDLRANIISRFQDRLYEYKRQPFRYRVKKYTFHSRAFLKIQDGCDYHCAYCRVPLARGSSLSLDCREIVKRAQEIERQGYREIVLTGVNVASYRNGGSDLPDLIGNILEKTSLIRLRLSSLEPEKIGNSFRKVLSDRRICPHFHISVQSGSDRILSAMKRHYSAEGVCRAVELIRSARPQAFIGGDFMAGFPGEEEQDFFLTQNLIKKLKFSKLHVFAFSGRPGTDALLLPDQVEKAAKRRRTRILLDLSKELYSNYVGTWKGRTVKAVLENDISINKSPGVKNCQVTELSMSENNTFGDNCRTGTARGLSENYLKLLISQIPSESARENMLISCRIDQIGNPCKAVFLNFCS